MNEAELVLTQILDCDRLSLYLNKDTKLSYEQSALVAQILKRRASGEPLQYILGKTEFMGLEFKVDRRVLIPRPETEILVESAGLELKSLGIKEPRILDLGTGSGCIGIALAKMLPQAQIWASDISIEALALAKSNAFLNNVKINFCSGDLFGAFQSRPLEFDLIVSNPPYVACGQIASLAKEISFEPVLALAAGSAGLDFYQRIIQQALKFLKPGGLLALELGSDQALAVKAMLGQENFKLLKIINDYNNIERVILAKKDLNYG